MDIFIAGCGRSGTTLATEMMRCFKDTYVKSSYQPGDPPKKKRGGYEHDYTIFETMDVPEPNRVAKRRFSSWETLHELPAHIKLIYCVRHPYDVLTSRHPLAGKEFYIQPVRWLEEQSALDKLRQLQPERKIYYARYEDYVTKTHDVEKSLSEFLGVPLEHSFLDHPLRVTIRDRSLHTWKQHPRRREYLQELRGRKRFGACLVRFADEFGYDLEFPPLEAGAAEAAAAADAKETAAAPQQSETPAS